MISALVVLVVGCVILVSIAASATIRAEKLEAEKEFHRLNAARLFAEKHRLEVELKALREPEIVYPYTQWVGPL